MKIGGRVVYRLEDILNHEKEQLQLSNCIRTPRVS
jgi:hypothetical protein